MTLLSGITERNIFERANVTGAEKSKRLTPFRKETTKDGRLRNQRRQLEVVQLTVRVMVCLYRLTSSARS